MEQKQSVKIQLSPVEIVDKLIDKGISSSASDIHIEPSETHTGIRMRIDGLISDSGKLPKTIHDGIISRLKILAGLRTDIRHSSQDGRFRFKNASAEVDVRLSLVPTHYGEKAVLRLLTRSGDIQSFNSLGLDVIAENKIKAAIASSHGMILVVGPTGSGKTTTLYSMIDMLVKEDISVVTIEDPIEYVVSKSTQIPVHAKSGFGFAQALRSVLRQDPDVIMVGEIRDLETATLAIQGALTGHLLLSTLHTTSAAATIPRLLDMGIEPYLLASTVRLIVAQRLVRRLCDSCKVVRPTTSLEKEYFEKFKIAADIHVPEKVYEGKGCDSCKGKGYMGRISISELLVVDDELRKLIESRASAGAVDEKMRLDENKTMIADGLEKVRQGATSLAEVLRVISE